MDAQPGDNFLDAQSEADGLLSGVARQVAPHGKAVGLVYGQRALKRVAQHLQHQPGSRNLSLKIGHITRLPCKAGVFTIILYRNTRNMRNFHKVMREAWRASARNARIIVCHLHWEYDLPPGTPAAVRTAMNDLSSPGFRDGVGFLNAFRDYDWREVNFDVYTLANNYNHDHSNNHSYSPAHGHGHARKHPDSRYHGDWTALARDILVHEKYYTPAQVHDLLTFVEGNEVAVRADRYLGAGVRA